MDTKDELKDAIINSIVPYVSQEDLSRIQMQLDIILSKYSIAEESTEIVPYSGDANESMIKKFLCAKIARGCSSRTIQYYQKTIRQFFQRVNKIYSDVTPDDIRVYMAIRVQRDRVSKTTVNNERRNLSSFYTWLQTEEIVLKNPMAKVEQIKVTKKKKKAFTLLDLEKIRAACKSSRETAIIETLVSTWCRVSELVSIKTSDIHGNKISVRGKGDKFRDVYLNARASIAIDTYLKERTDPNPYLFPGGASNFIRIGAKGRPYDWYKHPEFVSSDMHVDKGTVESMIRRIGRDAGVEHAHPHRFRRTGATLALRQGMPLIQVSKLLGHESIETTQIYLDISDDELEAAHEKYVI